MMKAIAFTATERAELVDWPFDDSPPRADEIIGRSLVTLASPGTELNYGYRAARTAPGLSGYAAVITVEAVGPDVKDIRPGQTVFCMGNHVSRHRTTRPQVVPVPAGLAAEVAVFCRLMGVSWTTLVTTTARPPDSVVVTGLGPVGNLAAQIFQAAGYAVTAVDPTASRRALAKQAGLTDVQETMPAFEAALAVECSGHEQAVLDCCQHVRKRGEVVLVGVPWHKRCELSAFDLLHAVFHRYVVLRSGWEWEVPHQPREFTTGSINGNLTGALTWLGQGRVRVDGLYQRIQPADAQSAWQDLLHQRGEFLTVVFDWGTVQ
jgi:threonine dehydrogenase-like Zn-dependent dehydrogenase